MATKDVALLMEKEFVTVKLDFDRGIGAKDIEKRYIDKAQGLPWFAFVAPDGTAIVHSTRPKLGNIGHPNAPDEVEYFKTMLQTAKKHLTDADIDVLITSLVAFNKAANSK
jgi:hypothetical protein